MYTCMSINSILDNTFFYSFFLFENLQSVDFSRISVYAYSVSSLLNLSLSGLFRGLFRGGKGGGLKIPPLSKTR